MCVPDHGIGRSRRARRQAEDGTGADTAEKPSTTRPLVCRLAAVVAATAYADRGRHNE